MKHLPKHLRPRWRYLAVALESWPDAVVERRSFQRELWYAGQNLLGDPGSARADLTVVRFEFEDGRGEALIKVRRGETDPARASLACIDEINGAPVGIRVVGISGTIRAAEENYLGRGRQESEERNVVFGNEQRVAVVRNRDGSADVRLADESFAGATDLDCDLA
ncbi:Rpp14/Pop5 family protein [Natronobacterium gregoryi]|uniref:Ribonuclease P protein component 2 n=2 Tax=Natronobacterium gregoryi TaxID=44930 RepID=L0AMR5_NATGS|nr:Rpp14/Pop5 family protein [Natronobacterium gregoryi]AFZ74754.1 RNase P/RNase MRP subunit POP5 [Natronobacterium gregoryi SP2]ELY73438.1 ribonuclease P protein component 2 [Natronobacterium gregoryi SP2]PLK20996.1 ribonuclease P [Natronobacterium gregoryi SP2]SFJ03243.1 ribonuclease P protein subunit Rpp14 [Natronobacterium gregoryi]